MERLEKHQPDYISKAYEAYTFQELGDWISLMAKRATHRANEEKKRKDVYDAKNYLVMMKEKLEKHCESLGIDFDIL